jgi:hypothetical protein
MVNEVFANSWYRKVTGVRYQRLRVYIPRRLTGASTNRLYAFCPCEVRDDLTIFSLILSDLLNSLARGDRSSLSESLGLFPEMTLNPLRR